MLAAGYTAAIYRERYHLLALPWIRLLFNGGHYATATLFIISGYVISRRPLELIQTGRVEQLANYLSSATFRRSSAAHVCRSS
ncbi:hypothetical protein N7449_007267 [Penicillium cf. viridicatum]|uniref:Uncharacterized protein n=1 Tax=Penicillium cf. viridicatum TaxID=2972119 RepID=A0A9W9JH61_9EURO|nr:hypothetical protein N7449_007267 [Penicillium cf. viridicatum]